jgi:hypothetical protein
MKIVKTALVVLALSLVAATASPGARADDYGKKTIITFSQPVEIPGQVLPAGTYTFKLLNSQSNRDIVEVFDADGSHLIATVLAIDNYRLVTTDQTVIKFSERPNDRPEALKAWFYPGKQWGQEFVYPKHRAIELAVAEKEPVPAITTDTLPPVEELTTAPIVAITPQQQEVPVAEVIQTAPDTSTAPAASAASTAPLVASNEAPAELPKTASTLPLVAFLAMASLGFAFMLKRIAG